MVTSFITKNNKTCQVMFKSLWLQGISQSFFHYKMRLSNVNKRHVFLFQLWRARPPMGSIFLFLTVSSLSQIGWRIWEDCTHLIFFRSSWTAFTEMMRNYSRPSQSDSFVAEEYASLSSRFYLTLKLHCIFLNFRLVLSCLDLFYLS